GAADEGVNRKQLLVKVHHGDLRFIRAPLLVGHYKSMTLTGAEAVIDGLLGNRMSKALRAGVYPEREGSFQIFENGRHTHAGRRKQRYIPRPRAAVVVGLGEEGKLSTQVLSYTVRIGVLAYAERFSEGQEDVPSLELAATLIGSGGTGVSVSASALALVQGVNDANMRLREAGWPTVGTLSIVEVYLDRATDAWRVLRMQSESMPGLVVEERLIPGDGSLRRPLDTSYRGATYDFISAVQSADSTEEHPKIAYSLDTRRARTEVRAQQAQGALVRDLVCKASNTTRPDKLIGRTLFNLLIPVEIEPYLTGSTDMLMELDSMTAALPWELLDTDPPQPTVDQTALRPWAIRSKVLRKLRTNDYRGQVHDAAIEDKMLVIGEPLTDPPYGALPGAKTEARAIAEVARSAFGVQGDWVTELNDSPNANTIINALFARNYRIVHIAGHGTGIDGCGRGGGVVLSGQSTFLGVNEIRAMRITPQLVFLNCCHLGQSTVRHYDRAAFAAGVATELINIGVRCVVAAGWAIEDKPAEVFARTFYGELFAGRRFIDAVGAARAAAWESQRECNTWAAYQCYGDPEWSWKAAGGTATPPPQEEYAGVASPLTLMLVLQTITTELLYTTDDSNARN
ncbi:MAG TPA: CHAT domain-containing protein, partial [Pseudoduganella sp.]